MSSSHTPSRHEKCAGAGNTVVQPLGGREDILVLSSVIEEGDRLAGERVRGIERDRDRCRGGDVLTQTSPKRSSCDNSSCLLRVRDVGIASVELTEDTIG